MATTLFLGGIFNIVDPVIQFQIYIWIWAICCVVAAVLHAAFYYGRWMGYKALHGLYWAWKYGSNAAMIFDAALNGELVSERDAKCIFDYSKEEYEIEIPKIPGALWLYSKIFYYPTYYLKNISPLEAIVYKFGGVNKDVEIARVLQNGEWERTPSVTCGGVDVDIIVDAGNWTIRTSKEHLAIERCCRTWNDGNPTDQIHSYSKFQKYLLEGKISCPEISPVYNVDWTRIDRALTFDMEASEYVGKQMQMAEQEYNADQMMKNRYAIYIFFGSFIFSVVVIGARLLLHYIH